MREQQRQQYLQQQLRTQRELGQDQAAIQQLQNELAQQNLKVDAMKQQGAETNTGAATEKDIEALKPRLVAGSGFLFIVVARAPRARASECLFKSKCCHIHHIRHTFSRLSPPWQTKQ